MAWKAGLSLVIVLAWMVAPSGGAAAEEEATAGDGVTTVGVVLYPGFEVLDVFGPVEMFLSVGQERMKVVMVAEASGPVASGPTTDAAGKYAGPKAHADYSFADAPEIDILLVPGGFGTLQAVNDRALLEFVAKVSGEAALTTSVCSGSAILARAGLLDEKKATSNKAYYTMLTAYGPKVEWVPKARWVEDGKMITSSGVSAGMDMALAIIARLYGDEAANAIADGTEYVWNRDPDNDPFARLIDGN
jgi:transcriptional regulator GlxA family with amidase domain